MDNIEIHPNILFGKLLNIKKTDKGIFLPETSTSKTPLVEILAAGSNISLYQKGDVVYTDPSYMRFAEIEGQEGVILMPDGIFAKVLDSTKYVSV